MAPISLPSFAADSIVARDALPSASLSAPVTTIFRPISNLLHRRNAQLSAGFDFKGLAKRLIARQSDGSNDPSVIPTTYGNENNSSSPGTIAGIVIGSVAGFLLILWLLRQCANSNNRSSATTTYADEMAYRDSMRRSSRRNSRSSETVEIRRGASPVRIVREEIRQEQPRRPIPVERVVVEERSRGGSDEVVVIEEPSPPRRSKSKRERRDSGFRTVDPLSFGGVVGGEGRRGERRR
ncbi:hypothetical protein CJF30_00001503 [Rutstroemia sp. NJR-2017a BBW]|nr:hypothetical protein CJF30_00001503 [Rutstroemia sp. NJR-2017a BBW]